MIPFVKYIKTHCLFYGDKEITRYIGYKTYAFVLSFHAYKLNMDI
jgi:hypothetical protein